MAPVRDRCFLFSVRCLGQGQTKSRDGYLTCSYGYSSILCMIRSRVIETAFGSPGRVKILRCLAREIQPLTGRQVAELAGLTHRGAIQALGLLVDESLVTQRQVGRACQYALARESVVVERVVLPALAAEERLVELLREELADAFSEHAVSLVLFGSYARGDQDIRSDIDLLLVAGTLAEKQAAEAAVEEQAPRLSRRFSAPLEVHCLAIAEVQADPAPAFVDQASREGTTLYGAELRELVKRGA